MSYSYQINSVEEYQKLIKKVLITQVNFGQKLLIILVGKKNGIMF